MSSSKLKILNLMECTPIAQFAIDLERKLVFANKACDILSGFPSKKLIGRTDHWRMFYDHERPVMADLIVDQDYDQLKKLYADKGLAKSRIVPHAWEATDYFPKLRDHARWIYYLAAPIFNDDGLMIGAVTTLQDVTEQKLHTESIERESLKLQQENLQLRSSIKERYRFHNIIGKSSAMQNVYELIVKAASEQARKSNVIIYGESGTGKELIAKAIHDMSTSHQKTFVPVNCGAIPENLLESEFFGHEKGAFSGAFEKREGVLDSANNGTLFLDELGELNSSLQVKLLRAIEGGGYTSVGGRTQKYSNFRIISATNRNLVEEVNRGNMREDFFYRIHVIPIKVPPLRERKEDIPLLIDHFMMLNQINMSSYTLPTNILDALLNYHWPGNVRELQNVINRYLTLGVLDFARTTVKTAEDTLPLIPPNNEHLNYSEAMDIYEKQLLKRYLDKFRWNRLQTASELNISRRTLNRKMNKHGLL